MSQNNPPQQFSLSGSWSAQPPTNAPSLQGFAGAPISEPMILDSQTRQLIDLSTDAPVSVDFSGVVNANVIIIKVTNGQHVVAKLTSSDGAAQAIPVDSVLVLITGQNRVTPVSVTAITLQRDAGVETTCDVFLGERA